MELENLGNISLENVEKQIYKPIIAPQIGDVFSYKNPILGTNFTFRIKEEHHDFYDIEIFLPDGTIKNDELPKDWDLLEMFNTELIIKVNEKE